MAIGSFLAEIGLSGGKGGIVFDDPVSSLDHRRRERVAKRLVGEAANRQVVILTHDIYFLCLLVDEAKLASVTISTQSLVRRAEGFGIADPELPFEGRNASKRIGALKAQHQSIAKLYKDGEEQEHRKQTVEAYFRLRMAWERGVEEVLLRQVSGTPILKAVAKSAADLPANCCAFRSSSEIFALELLGIPRRNT